MGQSENDQSKQMGIWQDTMSMVLLTSGHLQTELYDTTNIERVKKRVMKYHWLEDTMFFQNQVVPRATKREC
jgi:hypothetical protein